MEHLSVIVDATRHLLDESQVRGVSRFVHCSTVGVQGGIDPAALIQKVSKEVDRQASRSVLRDVLSRLELDLLRFFLDHPDQVFDVDELVGGVGAEIRRPDRPPPPAA